MAYNPNSLISSADTMKFKAFLVVVFYAICFYIAYSVFQDLHSHLKAIQPGDLSSESLRDKAQFAKLMSFVFGGMFGLFRAQSLYLDANKLLCMVEQEKHLRKIAGLVDKDVSSRLLG